MNYILLDTCVWLSLADWRETVVLAALGELVHAKKISVVLPDLVEIEFARNEVDTLSKREKAAKSHVKQLRTWVELLDKAEDQDELKALLDKLNKQAEQRTLIARKSTDVVRALMNQGIPSATTDQIQGLAFRCCLDKNAPCHRGKNSLADAVILEHFKAIDVSKNGIRKFFVTDNSEDFGAADKRKPHENLQAFFDEKVTHYRTNVAEMLNEIQPGIVSTTVVDNVASLQESMRQLRLATCHHKFDENEGSWLRSQYGGLTWQLRCRNCGALFDTGEPYD